MPDIYISGEEVEKKPRKKKKTKKETKKKDSESPTPTSFKNPLLSYYYMPQNVEFETKDAKEKIYLVLRRHPVTNLKWALIALFMVFAPIFLSVFPILTFLPASYQFIVILGWYLITTAFVLENFLSWYFNVDIVTDERIIDIEFYNLVYKQVSDAKIDRIQDITYKTSGALRSLLGYGDVLIQTAGEVPNFEFLGVPNPEKVVEVIQKERLEEEREKLEGRVR